MAAIFLKLIFRYPDGTLTFFFWFFGALGLLMVAAGVWCLVAPESYARRMIRRRSRRLLRWPSRSALEPVPAPTGRFWASHLGWVRLGGAVGIALGIAVIGWLVFFSVPGRLY